jgi:hypothetical protein
MHAGPWGLRKDSVAEIIQGKPAFTAPPKANDLVLLFFLTAAAILVHGYHPFVEDAEIYVPGIKKLLNPALYPLNEGFFASHARLTLFPNLIEWSVRVTHLPLEWALLAWHFGCIFLLLAGCWKLGRTCFGSARAAWGGAILVASLLTIPVAGTALYIMDQYVNPRSFSTAASLWIVLAVLRRKYSHAAIWIVLVALVHPLMALFGLAYAALLIGGRHMQQALSLSSRSLREYALALFPLMLFPPVTSAYRQVLESHSYFFLLRWAWYEWLGIFGPLLLLWWLGRIARRRKLVVVERLCFTSIVFGEIFLVIGLAIAIPPQFVRLAELQPMRSLLLIYVLLFVISGGLLAEHVLKTKWWRWLVFVPLCVGMFYAQRQLFPATPHLELPGRGNGNRWVQTFLWIRGNTPVNAYFALDPEHMRLPGEDQHGFRAVAERSMLADRVKDSGAVTMFPALAQIWLDQVSAQQGWKDFGVEDFAKLHQRFGVDWVVLRQSGVAGMDCPYRNASLLVCRIEEVPQAPESK